MINSFSQLQQQLADYLRDPEHAAPPADIEPQRLAVYQELVFNNICSFINSAYPVLHSLYAATAWHALIQRFIHHYRCQSPYFLDIAGQFLLFLQQDYRLQPEDPPFLTELAHYEWAELYIATVPAQQQKRLLKNNELATTALELTLPALLCAYHYPVQEICSSFQPVAPTAPLFFLLYRNQQEDVVFTRLSQSSAILLETLQQRPGLTLSALIDAIQPLLANSTKQQLQTSAEVLLHELAGKGAVLSYSG